MAKTEFDEMFTAVWDIAFLNKPCQTLQEKIEAWLNTNPQHASNAEGLEWTMILVYATGENKHLLNEKPMGSYKQNRDKFLERYKELLLKYKPWQIKE